MRNLFKLWLVVVLVGVFAVPTTAQTDGEIIITGAWTRATATMPEAEATEPPMTDDMGSMDMGTMSGVDVSGTYMIIENVTGTGLSLVAASAEVAGIVEIHETQIDDAGVMRMNAISGLEIPAGGQAVLEPGGFHVMLMDLQRDLFPGEALNVTLTFELLDDGGAATGETLDLIIGSLVRQEPPEANDIAIITPWARPTVTDADMGEMAPEATEMPMADMGEMGGEMPMAGGVSGVYMEILNRGADDRLIAAATDVAGVVEIHETQIDDAGVMRMNPIIGIDLPSRQIVTLQPGGLHVMLMDLRRDLIPGQALRLTLTFESGRELTVAVPVYDRLMMGMGQ
ncbi:MAG: copper chaperone PCu(A)C [Chloroflexi bacterium]|nr:copper chaperone PCu(A)C [Chloroflexota bacterium]